jgi:ribose/xylose/arabinose/galactoside ABC-type transport system permease subunit
MATEQLAPVGQQTPTSGASGAAGRILVRLVGAREAIIAVVVVALMAYLALATPYFWTVDNLMILARQIALVAIIAIGMTFVIVMGGIDLSVGSVVALASVMTGYALVIWGFPLPLGILVGLLVGVAAGFVNGFLHVKTRVAPFIITLGMMGFARGLALVITKGSTISGLPSDFLYLGQGFVFSSPDFVGIPVPVVIAVVLAIAAHIFLSRTAMGRHVYFIGSNEEAALLSGINVGKLKVIIYTACATLAAMSAVVETSRMSTAQPASGTGYELIAIASVIIGGASLNGGEGTVLGTVLGAALLGLITNGLIHLGIETYWQQVFVGTIIVIAVALDTWRHSRGK